MVLEAAKLEVKVVKDVSVEVPEVLEVTTAEELVPGKYSVRVDRESGNSSFMGRVDSESIFLIPYDYIGDVCNEIYVQPLETKGSRDTKLAGGF